MAMHERKRILYAEDDSAAARLLQRRLKRVGYDVDIAAHGEEIGDKWLTGSYDIFLTEHEMPGKSGLDLIREFASRGPLPPTIVITGHGNEMVAVEAMKLGADDYVMKDTEARYLDLIPAKIDDALKRRLLAEEKRQAQDALKEREQELRVAVHQLRVHQVGLEAQNNMLREAQIQLAEARDRFTDLYDFAPVGYVTTNGDGLIIETNLTMGRLLGIDRTCLLNAPFCRFICMEDKDDYYLHVAKVLETQTKQTLHVRLTGRNGELIHVQLDSVSSRDASGKNVAIRTTVSDITNRKKTEELSLKTARLKAVTELAAGVAHNFNNLLQTVMGHASLALLNLGRGDFSNIRENLQEILQSSRLGAETVRRVNRFAKTHGDARFVEPLEVFDLSDLTREAVEVTKPWWKSAPEKRGITITLEAGLAQGCAVHARKTEIFEVLVNLVKNAAEALPKGGQIRIETRVDSGTVVLSVQDTGIGIAAKDLDRIFTPFFSTSPEAGRGLGLATSRRIVDDHGGSLEVESARGMGSLFALRLPLCDSLPEAEAPPEPMPLGPLRILAMDDVEATVKMLRAVLERSGHTVLSALSGEEGLRVFNDNHVDAVICDLGMPGMNGWQVGKAIKETCRSRGTSKPPFVIFTGWSDQAGETDKIAESGVDAVIEKPVDVERLFEILAILAQGRRRVR